MLILVSKQGKYHLSYACWVENIWVMQYINLLHILLLYFNCCCCFSFPVLIRLKPMSLLDKFHMENHGFQEVVNEIHKTKSLYQLIMHLATSLRQPNYNGFIFRVARNPDQLFLLRRSQHVDSFSSCHFMVGTWLLKLVDEWYRTFRHQVYIGGERWLENSEAPCQPHLSFFINKTKLF